MRLDMNRTLSDHSMKRQLRNGERGTTLIEVLVSVLILGVGLLGIAALQAATLINTQSSTERTQAVIHSYSILDAMRANADDALVGAYNVANLCAAPLVTTLPTADLNSWITGLRATNQNGCGTINCEAVNRTCTVTVTWNDSRASGGLVAQTLTTVGGL
jgi:type IV pilus assembly protein PilV